MAAVAVGRGDEARAVWGSGGGALRSSCSVTLHPLSHPTSPDCIAQAPSPLPLLAEFCQWKAPAKGQRRVLAIYSPMISPRLTVVSAAAGVRGPCQSAFLSPARLSWARFLIPSPASSGRWWSWLAIFLFPISGRLPQPL